MVYNRVVNDCLAETNVDDGFMTSYTWFIAGYYLVNRFIDGLPKHHAGGTGRRTNIASGWC